MTRNNTEVLQPKHKLPSEKSGTKGPPFMFSGSFCLLLLFMFVRAVFSTPGAPSSTQSSQVA